jgi:hypothetical protein
MAGVPHIRLSIVPSNWFIPRLSDHETAAVSRERQLKHWSHGKKAGIGGGKYPTVEASKQTSFLTRRMKNRSVVVL